MFIIGDDIIYWDEDGSQWPGKIIHIHEIIPTILIEINCADGNKRIWTKPINLTH